MEYLGLLQTQGCSKSIKSWFLEQGSIKLKPRYWVENVLNKSSDVFASTDGP